MSSTRDLRMLSRYTAWADSRLLSAMQALPQGELALLRAEGPGCMLSMLGIMAHCHIIDLIWKAHLEGRPHGFTSRLPETLPALEALREQQAEIDQWYVEYADALTEATHGEIVHFDFVDGGSGAMSRRDILLHVVNHKTYHRGYVVQMFYQAQARPPVMDIPIFLRDAELRL